MKPIWEKDLEVPEEMIRFSIVIPTFNSARRIRWTLQSLEMQNYPEIEVIIVDAGSTDATLEVVQRSNLKKARIYTVAEYNLFEMANRGISQATGRYISILTPGGAYLSQQVTRHIRSLIHTHDEPDVIYCGAILRDPGADPRVLLRTLSSENLKRGLQPTSYQACWYRIDTLRRLGKLNPDYRVRGGFDLFCRIARRPDLKVVFSERIFYDRDRRQVTPTTLLRRAWETLRIIRKHYGFSTMLTWALKQNHWRIIRWWWRSKRPQLWS